MSDHTPDMSANAAEVRHVLNEHTQRLREVRDAVLLLTKKQEESGTLPLAPGATTSTVSERREPEAPKPRKREELPPAPIGAGVAPRWSTDHGNGNAWHLPYVSSSGSCYLDHRTHEPITGSDGKCYGNVVRYANSLPPIDGYGWHPDNGTPCPWAPEWRKTAEPEDPWALPDGSTAEWVELVRGGFCLFDYGADKDKPFDEDAHAGPVWAVILQTDGKMGVIGNPPQWAIDIFRRRNRMDAEPDPSVEPAFVGWTATPLADGSEAATAEDKRARPSDQELAEHLTARAAEAFIAEHDSIAKALREAARALRALQL